MSSSRQSSRPQSRKPKGEIAELQDFLNNNKIDQKKEAVRKIIDAMTRGKDVSVLFPEMVKNMETSNMELKKLIYLYIINYSKSQPDLALLGINSFRKDARDKTNPFLRALAVRTMGCIRVKHIVEYLLDPLKNAIKDEDSYVRKTAAICIGKLYDLNPELIEEQGFLKLLEQLVNDGNAMVVSNAIITQLQISEIRGEKLVVLTSYTVSKLLTALDDCNEWGAIYILDALSTYNPGDSKETEKILDRVSSRLSHQNPGVVLSATKLVMKYLDILSNPDSIRLYQKKLTAPLISLLASSGKNEIIFLALKNINLILQKKPTIIEKELKVFFCNFNDPIYIKLHKLEILIRLANQDNILQILHELKEYTQEVDVEFVRKSVKAIGRCAIKLEKQAEKCVTVLYDCLKSKVSYVVQETIIVIRDIFRKYPRKYEKILKDLCDNLKFLDDPDSKAAMIWIIGEYVDTIDNADELLTNFSESFNDEQGVVQQQIIQSCLKLFLQRPQDGYTLVQNVLKMATNEAENPDLRDRAYIYWRLLNHDVELTKQIVYSERPTISDQSYSMESDLLDKLIENIGNLASVYYQPPEKFVKKLRESENLREQEELEDIQAGEEFLQDIGDPGKDAYEGVQVQENTNNNNDFQSQQQQEQQPQINDDIDLLGDDIPTQQPQQQQQQQQQPQQNYQQQQQQQQQQPDLLDDLLGDGPIGQPQQQQQNIQQSQQQPQQIPYSNCSNVKLPLQTVVEYSSFSKNNKVSGLEVQAAFQLENDQIYLYMQVHNKSPNLTFDQFGVNFNANSFSLAPAQSGIGNIQLGSVAPMQSSVNKIQVLGNGPKDNQPPGTPFQIQCAMHTSLDVYIFYIPCSFAALLIPSQPLSPQQYSEFVPKMQNTNDSIPSNLAQNTEALKQRLQENQFNFVGSRVNQQGVEMASFSTKIINNMPMLLDIIIDKNNNRLNVRCLVPHAQMLENYLNALKSIINN